MKTLKIALILGAVFLGYSAFASDPVISDVTVRQRWPWSKLVDIDYVLTCDDAEQTVNIELSGFNSEMPLAIPHASLSGDLESVSYGAHRIVWDPTVTAYTNAGVLSKFSVVLTPTPVPLYMIVNLTKAPGEISQIEYVYESELRTGKWGSWVENPVSNHGTNIQSVVWTGVTTNDIYKTDKLVMRYVPAGSFVQGTSGLPTTLTKACYAGVFPVTVAQWGKIMGGGSTILKPKDNVSYDNIRGAPTDVPSINWPTTDRTLVTSGSFLGKLRTKTGFSDFDLPTDAQWEYLCRAGTTTVFNDGNANANVYGANALTNEWLDALGWYKGNCTAAHPVGEKLSNAWGLYDMHGNMAEWCLDSNGVFGGGVDPVGPVSGVQAARVLRGGAWNTVDTSEFVSAFRNAYGSDAPYNGFGFRLVRTLP